MKVTLISGLSGSGKSIALKSLEDCGYFCVDNLPMALLPALIADESRHSQNLAVSIDIRSMPRVDYWQALLRLLQDSGNQISILYLEASDDILLRRFSETRRSHPLGRDQTTLFEAVAFERDIMSTVRDTAFVVDTSSMTVQQLRSFVRDWVGIQAARLSLVFQSFGFKHGLPSDVNFVFDVRSLANPYYDPALREFTGRDAPIQAFFKDYAPIWKMIGDIEHFLTHWLPLMAEENRRYVSVGIGCTGGQHRSVFIAEALSRLFPDYPVMVRHRQLNHLESVRSPDVQAA